MYEDLNKVLQSILNGEKAFAHFIRIHETYIELTKHSALQDSFVDAVDTLYKNLILEGIIPKDIDHELIFVEIYNAIFNGLKLRFIFAYNCNDCSQYFRKIQTFIHPPVTCIKCASSNVISSIHSIVEKQ